MARKKRKSQHVATEEIMPTPKRDLISSLPWELIAEILSMTGSPKEVLALARCSRHFCNSLVVNPRSKCIWEAARESCSPPIPNPTPNFTEPAYAAYIFDGGPCEECGTFTNTFFASFSLRLRFCTRKCHSDWTKENAVEDRLNKEYAAIRSWLISSEGTMPTSYAASHYRVFRKSDLQQAVKEYQNFLGPDNDRQNKRELYRQLHENDAKRKNAILALSGELLSWTSLQSAIAESVRHENIKLLRKIAEREGWNLGNVVNAPTCAAFYKHYKRMRECFTEQNFNLIKADVEAEISRAIEKRDRSKEEQAYANRRKLVELDYHRKKSTDSSPSILPTLNVFRDQPVIKAMQNKHGSVPGDVAKRLDDPSVKGMIDDNLSVWRDQTRNSFMKILGVKRYSEISTKKLHPVDRLTARFLCSKCLQHASDETGIASLDFRKACTHQCPYLTKKQKSKAKWSPVQFRVDYKAAEATRKVLNLLDIPEDDVGSSQVMGKTQDRILCKSCNGKIVMNFKAMQQHSHRHEDMTLDLLSAAQVKERNIPPIHWGLCSELTSMAKSAPRKAGLRTYGCRHCLQLELSIQEESLADTKKTDGEEGRPKNRLEFKGEQQKLMSFHGMRCHVLQRHGIANIADEDIYRYEDVLSLIL